MSNSKIKVGAYVRIDYKGKWYRAKIIEMTNDNIVIKLWKSPFKTKLFDVPRKPNWINMVLQRKIYYDSGIFPKWAKISKDVCILEPSSIKSSLHSIKYYKIGDIYGNNMILYGTYKDISDFNKVKLVTKTIKLETNLKKLTKEQISAIIELTKVMSMMSCQQSAEQMHRQYFKDHQHGPSDYKWWQYRAGDGD